MQQRKNIEKITDEFFANASNSYSVLDFAPVIIVGVNPASKIVFFNQAAEIVSGYNRNEVLSTPWQELVAIENSQLIENIKYERRQGNHPPTLETKVKTKKGDTRLISWVLHDLRDQENHRSILAYGTDITQKRDIENRMKILEEAFD